MPTLKNSLTELLITCYPMNKDEPFYAETTIFREQRQLSKTSKYTPNPCYHIDLIERFWNNYWQNFSVFLPLDLDDISYFPLDVFINKCSQKDFIVMCKNHLFLTNMAILQHISKHIDNMKVIDDAYSLSYLAYSFSHLIDDLTSCIKKDVLLSKNTGIMAPFISCVMDEVTLDFDKAFYRNDKSLAEIPNSIITNFGEEISKENDGDILLSKFAINIIEESFYKAKHCFEESCRDIFKFNKDIDKDKYSPINLFSYLFFTSYPIAIGKIKKELSNIAPDICRSEAMSLFNNVHEEFSKDKLVKHWEKNILAKDGEKAMAGKLFDEIKKGKELDAVFNSVSIIVELCILDDILRGNEVKYSIDFGDKVKNEQGYFFTDEQVKKSDLGMHAKEMLQYIESIKEELIGSPSKWAVVMKALYDDKNIKCNEDAESFYDKVIRMFDTEVKLSSFKTEFGRVKNKDFEVESDWGRDKRNENKISLYKKIRDFIKRMVNDKVNETKR